MATELGISASAVRQHLTGLRSAGMVAARQIRGRPGRPVDIYHSTDLGDTLFAGPSDDVMVELLEHIQAEDPDLVDRAFDQRQHRRTAEVAARLTGKDLPERVAELSAILDGEGYLSDFEALPDGGYRLILHNCAIWSVATRYRQACTTELDFLQEVLPETKVTRAMHRGDGSFACGYEVHPITAT